MLRYLVEVKDAAGDWCHAGSFAKLDAAQRYADTVAWDTWTGGLWNKPTKRDVCITDRSDNSYRIV